MPPHARQRSMGKALHTETVSKETHHLLPATGKTFQCDNMWWYVASAVFGRASFEPFLEGARIRLFVQRRTTQEPKKTTTIGLIGWNPCPFHRVSVASPKHCGFRSTVWGDDSIPCMTQWSKPRIGIKVHSTPRRGYTTGRYSGHSGPNAT